MKGYLPIFPISSSIVLYDRTVKISAEQRRPALFTLRFLITLLLSLLVYRSPVSAQIITTVAVVPALGMAAWPVHVSCELHMVLRWMGPAISI